MNRKTLGLVVLVLFGLGLGGCAGTKSFTTAARPGDTVALAVGWNVNITRANLAATVTPFSGPPVTYAINNPNIRAVVNMYPDPMSRLVVGTETAQPLGVNANVYGAQLNSWNLEDKDMAQTMVFLNLPAGIATGTANIQLTKNGALLGAPFAVNVLSGVGAANTFDGTSGSMSAEQLATLERASGSVVSFTTASVVPHSIQLEVARTPGVGTPWVVNPRGDVKNVSWSDNGSAMKVIISPVNGQSLTQMIHFKFFISGGVTGFGVPTVKAYDVNGNPISGVIAAIQGL